MTEQKDYTKYDFKQDVELTISPAELGFLFKTLDLIVEKNVLEKVDFLFDKIHNETGKPAKKNTTKKVLDRDYRSVLNPHRMVQADTKKSLTREGMEALKLVLLLQDIRNRNIDQGKGYEIIEEDSKEPLKVVENES